MNPPDTTPNPARNPHLVWALLALSLGGFSIGTTEFAAMTLVPFFSPDLGIDVPTAGRVISAYALGVVVGAPVLATLGARLPRRTLLILLMLAFALGNGLSALAPGYHSMLLFRFLSGLPHGAYFGVGALVAASLVAPERRAQAVSMMMLGLTVATIIGVPLANALGQWVGWRWGFGVVAVLALSTAALVAAHVPKDEVQPGASAMRELGALARRQVWLTLGIGAVGFGGMFAVYTYLASTLLEVTGASPATLPLVFSVFGVGMTVGTLVCAWAADRALMPTVGGILLWSVVALALYPFAAGSLWTLLPVVFMIGCSGGMGTVLQTRLMDVAGDAQTLAAALNHSAFNAANALGPWLGGIAIAAGYGWTSTGWVGAILAIGGLLIWGLSLADDRRRATAWRLASPR
ncbi:MFS transporter, DHA1 family, arabinose polymer transporter [Roseateles sp. YR242]|uniref:MFS transporter n=1 Tax=Roseateles sp. YR242 TaxID=1855305 RepID=UPI0008B6A8D3|nr:MFS transporter [Roseateles sp. YR242]SEL46625.1 MFS transporter, DHA1 family, arabinose polymer transporter [Roseateles sp. YR242]